MLNKLTVKYWSQTMWCV